MKKFLILAVMMLTALCAQAQFFTGIEVGGAVQYSVQSNKDNAGFGFRATKRTCPWSRLRAEAVINGVIPNGFDRGGTLTVGASADLMPIYVFAGYGLSVNPSSKSKLGMTFDLGLGLDVNLAQRWHLFTELDFNWTKHAKVWLSTPAVKVGTTFSL